jgi:V/A-type H+-transporting ATPase subunit I
MLSFVVFYGFCLGDAVYGLVQLAIALALMKRYRSYPGLRNFFALLAWGAVSSFIVGVLTGSWAADIWSPKYLGEGNPLEKLASALMIGDPLQKPLVVLGIALAMGVLNQLWGITMKFYSCWRQGDKRGAIFDAGFWYLVLPGLVLLVAWFFSTEPPAWPLHVGGALMGVGGLGLVLTNGRKEKSLAGKAIVGLVSLYGIVGSYGCLSFVGDTLSYSRLLALALTTTIVGMAINIIGAIINQMLGLPMLVGIVVFAVVAVPAHFLNLVLSGLGAFIHSARLIFVEFFGRFYEPGAQRFAPLGSTGGRIRVMD